MTFDILSTDREAALQSTLRNAARTPFYRKHWTGIDLCRVSRDRLSQLPLVMKAMIRAAGRDAQNRSGMTVIEVLTGGTTGQPLVTVRGERERRAIHRYFEASQLRRHRGLRRRVLKFNDPFHGSHVAIPTKDHIHRVGIYDAYGFEYATEVLISRYDDAGVHPRCTLMIGGLRDLKAFAEYTLARFPGGCDTALDAVVTFAGLLTEKWRARIEAAWRAPVIDRYGLSEVTGGASQDPLDGWYRFDPFVIPEVISATNKQPIRDGIGELVLTPLFPFQEAQPLVRYATGDLVQVIADLSIGGIAVRPLGRAAFGVLDEATDKWLASPKDIIEAIERCSGIARRPLLLDAAHVRDHHEIGIPVFQVERQRRGNMLHITVAIEPAQGLPVQAARSLVRTLHRELLGQSSALAAAVARGGTALDVSLRRNLSAVDVGRAE